MDWAIFGVACLLVGVGVGLWLGYRIASEQCAERVERMERVLDLPSRAKGEPVNPNIGAARVTTGRYKQRRRWRLQ